MKTLTLGLCLVSLLAGSAAAQQPDPPPPPPPQPEPEPTPVPTPTPPPNNFVETKQPPIMTEPIDDDRPSGFSVGIGFGYELPNSLETPNVTSARFRLASGLTFEPVARFQQESTEIDIGMSSEEKRTTLELGILARYPFKSRGRVDLVLLGGASVQNVTEKPDADNIDSASTTIDVNYGLAVEFWISRHWQISMSALNTIVSMERESQEMGIGTETVTTNTLFGAIYRPSIAAMVHLYY